MEPPRARGRLSGARESQLFFVYITKIFSKIHYLDITTAATSTEQHYNEARERSEPFFLGFPRKKKPLQNGSYEHRVPKVKKPNIILYQVCVCDSTS